MRSPFPRRFAHLGRLVVSGFIRDMPKSHDVPPFLRTRSRRARRGSDTLSDDAPSGQRNASLRSRSGLPQARCSVAFRARLAGIPVRFIKPLRRISEYERLIREHAPFLMVGQKIALLEDVRDFGKVRQAADCSAETRSKLDVLLRSRIASRWNNAVSLVFTVLVTVVAALSLLGVFH
jgi:hypothetical protein